MTLTARMLQVQQVELPESDEDPAKMAPDS